MNFSSLFAKFSTVRYASLLGVLTASLAAQEAEQPRNPFGEEAPPEVPTPPAAESEGMTTQPAPMVEAPVRPAPVEPASGMAAPTPAPQGAEAPPPKEPSALELAEQTYQREAFAAMQPLLTEYLTLLTRAQNEGGTSLGGTLAGEIELVKAALKAKTPPLFGTGAGDGIEDGALFRGDGMGLPEALYNLELRSNLIFRMRDDAATSDRAITVEDFIAVPSGNLADHKWTVPELKPGAYELWMCVQPTDVTNTAVINVGVNLGGVGAQGRLVVRPGRQRGLGLYVERVGEIRVTDSLPNAEFSLTFENGRGPGQDLPSLPVKGVYLRQAQGSGAEAGPSPFGTPVMPE